MNTGFQFKQFFVKHDKCAMKVGTDGVLLGAWAPSRSAIAATDAACGIKGDNASALPTTTCVVSGTPIYRILDVGTGSGLIALMLAQRCPDAHIDAIDIAPDAVAQARENFAASPWADRLHVAQCALQDWQMVNGKCENGKLYDFIVSNPPYFVNSLKNPDAARCTARHNDTLPFIVLIAESAKRLAPGGTLALIVPAEAEAELQSLAEAHSLHCTHRCYVHPKPGRPAKRVLLAWQHVVASAIHGGLTTHLTLEDDHGARSLDYQQLTKDFYL